MILEVDEETGEVFLIEEIFEDDVIQYAM